MLAGDPLDPRGRQQITGPCAVGRATEGPQRLGLAQVEEVLAAVGHLAPQPRGEGDCLAQVRLPPAEDQLADEVALDRRPQVARARRRGGPADMVVGRLRRLAAELHGVVELTELQVQVGLGVEVAGPVTGEEPSEVVRELDRLGLPRERLAEQSVAILTGQGRQVPQRRREGAGRQRPALRVGRARRRGPRGDLPGDRSRRAGSGLAGSGPGTWVCVRLSRGEREVLVPRSSHATRLQARGRMWPETVSQLSIPAAPRTLIRRKKPSGREAARQAAVRPERQSAPST